MLKRTTFALMLAAALAAAAPSGVPAAVAAAPPAPGVETEIGSGGLAWSEYFTRSGRPFFNNAYFDGINLMVCTLVPVFLAMGPAGAVVYGMSCGLTGIA